MIRVLFFARLPALMAISFLCLVNSVKATQIDDQILSNATNHLFRIDPNSAVQSCTPTIRWAHYIEKIRNTVPQFLNLTEAIHFAQTAISFDHRGYPCLLKDAALFENTLSAEFPQFRSYFDSFYESPYSVKESLVYYKDRYVSNVLYYQMRYVLQCLTYVEKPSIVCEIGGGYGGPARLWMQNSIHNPATYIIVDFPESLFFSEIFLSANLRNVNVIYIDELTYDQLSEQSSLKNMIILCPTNKVELLKTIPIDLVINTGSMQEMSEDALAYWFKWLDESMARHFYSLNFFGYPMIDRYYGNAYCQSLSTQWKCLLKKTNPPFVVLQGGPCFAEILAERSDSKPQIDKAELNRSFYRSLETKVFDKQTLLDCFDILRFFSQDPKMIWGLAYKIYKEMDPLPLEICYLLKLVDQETVNTFDAKTYSEYTLLKRTVDSFLLHADHANY